MKRLIHLTLLLLVCCSSDKTTKPVEENDSTQKAAEASLDTPVDKSSGKDSLDQYQEENDCVFNDDYKGLTTEWLKELGKEKYIWRADLEQALLTEGQDTVYLTKGGCEHFGTVVELKTNSDNLATDSTFWISKALQLAPQTISASR